MGVIQGQAMKTVDFTDTGLSRKDGKILLDALKGGSLGHIHSLSLLQNPELAPLAQELMSVCERQHIDLQCSHLSSKSQLGLVKKLLYYSIGTICCSRETIWLMIFGILLMIVYFVLNM